MPDVNLSPYDARQAALNRRRQLAAALQQQSMEPLQAPAVAGAKISPWEGVNKLVQALLAGSDNRKLDKEQESLNTEMQTDRAARMQQMAQALGVDPSTLGGDFDNAIVSDALARKRQKEDNDARMAQILATPRNIDPLSEQGVAAQQALNPPQPRNIDPLSPEGIAAQLQIRPPQEPTPRNIDPLSPAGVAAQLQLAQGKPQAERDERIVQVMGPNGQPIWVRESQAVGQPAAQAARAVTGQERNVLAFYNRAKEASDTITRPDPSGSSLEERMAKQSLAGQVQGKFAPNVMQSAEQQAYRQAQRAFTEARLRKESGAAIPTHEYENDSKTYFAQPGDSLQTIEQKRKARQTVLDGLAFSSGKAYDEFYGEPAKKAADKKADPLGIR